jgi:hypothetical protein
MASLDKVQPLDDLIVTQMSHLSLQGDMHLSEAGKLEFGQKLCDFLVQENSTSPQALSHSISHWLDKHIGDFAHDLAQVSALVYMMVKERMCFQNLGYIANMKRVLELTDSLKSRGVRFFHAKDPFTTHVVLSDIDERIPWKVLRLICRLEFLSQRKKGSVASPELRELIHDCFSVQEAEPSQTGMISTVLDIIRCMELQEKSSASLALMEYEYQYLYTLQQASPPAAPAVQEFLAGMSDYIRRISELTKEAAQMTSVVRNEATERLAKKATIIQAIFVRAVEKSIALYESPDVRQARGSFYSQYFKELQEKKDKVDASLDQVVLHSISLQSPLRAPIRMAGMCPRAIMQAVQDMDVRSIPVPQEYLQPLKAIEFQSFVDICEEFFQKKEEAAQRASTSKSPGFSDFTSSRRSSASKRKPIQKKHKARRRPEAISRPLQGKADTVSPCREDSCVEPIVPPEESVAPKTTSFQRECEDGRSPSASAPDGELEEGSWVQIGDGPDTSLHYADHVARWFDLRRDIFHEDPNYRVKPYSDSLQDEIRFRHTFGLALVPVILRCGKQFMKKDPRTGQIRLSYTLPGEIIRHERYEKAVFTVSVAKATGHVIHMYATNKTPLTIIQEYARDGWFPAADEEVNMMPCSSERNYRSYTLEDDGSRITEETDEFITVTQTDGTTLTVYSFPQT